MERWQEKRQSKTKTDEVNIFLHWHRQTEQQSGDGWVDGWVDGLYEGPLT